jgi:beta-carotene hydroxylase
MSTTMPASEKAMIAEEAVIARQYMGRVPWEMVVWGLGNLAVWLALWPLTFSGVLPLWTAFGLSTVCIILSYLPSHEAQHSIIAANGKPLRWLNELVGHVSTIPLVLPYRIAWITHRMHHANTNDPQLDPDYSVKGERWWQSVWGGIRDRQPGSDSAYRTLGKSSDDPEVRRAIAEAGVMTMTYYAVLSTLAWSGHAIEAFWIWWLPRQIGYAYIQVFLSWLPHYPMEGQGRYRDTRAWRSPVGTILSLGMEYHVVHHLFPRIPLCQTGPAYRALKPLLERRGVRNDGL